MTASIQRYLLRSERNIVQVRRHWAALWEAGGVFIAGLAGIVVVNLVLHDLELIQVTTVFFFLFSLAWFLWQVAEWYVELFVVTDKRVLLVSGIITRRVAIMPLVKVTDLTFERSLAGQFLGYGAFVMESAGQRQALSRIDFLPDPEKLYHDVSDLLFGPKSPLDEDETPPTHALVAHLVDPSGEHATVVIDPADASTGPLPRF
jgi:uncharacterized membrane protein YdbT with pleckstrin-like domain